MLKASLSRRARATQCSATQYACPLPVSRVRSPYEVLGVDVSADIAQVKSAFRRKCLQVHPDVCKDHQCGLEFMEAQKAYDALTTRLLSAADVPSVCFGHHASGYDSLMKGAVPEAVPVSAPARRRRPIVAAAPVPSMTAASPAAAPQAAAATASSSFYSSPQPSYYTSYPSQPSRSDGASSTSSSRAASAPSRAASRAAAASSRPQCVVPLESVSYWLKSKSMMSEQDLAVHGLDSDTYWRYGDDGESRWRNESLEAAYKHFSGPVAPQPARAVVAAAYAAGKRRWF